MEQTPKTGIESRLVTLLEKVSKHYGFGSMLISDGRGLPVASFGPIKREAIAAVAPEFVKLGDNAARFGKYAKVTCITLVLEDSHLLIMSKFMVDADMFVLAFDTQQIPKGVGKIMTMLTERFVEIIKAGRS